MLSKIGRLRKPLAAPGEFAHEGLLARVCTHVYAQSRRHGKTFATYFTFVRLFSRVYAHVLPENVHLAKRVAADITPKWLVVGVDLEVSCDLLALLKRLVMPLAALPPTEVFLLPRLNVLSFEVLGQLLAIVKMPAADTPVVMQPFAHAALICLGMAMSVMMSMLLWVVLVLVLMLLLMCVLMPVLVLVLIVV